MKKKNIAAVVITVILLLVIISFLVGIYKFLTMDGKSWVHYTVIGYTILTLLGVIWAAAACYRRRGSSEKWPWLFLILLGVGEISINLTTGGVGFNFIKLQIPYISFKMAIKGSSYLSIAFPLGAVLYSLYHTNDLKEVMDKKSGEEE